MRSVSRKAIVFPVCILFCLRRKKKKERKSTRKLSEKNDIWCGHLAFVQTSGPLPLCVRFHHTHWQCRSAAGHGELSHRQWTLNQPWKVRSTRKSHGRASLPHATRHAHWSTVLATDHRGWRRSLTCGQSTKPAHSYSSKKKPREYRRSAIANLLRHRSGSIQRAERLKIQNPRELKNVLLCLCRSFGN